MVHGFDFMCLAVDFLIQSVENETLTEQNLDAGKHVADEANAAMTARVAMACISLKSGHPSPTARHQEVFFCSGSAHFGGAPPATPQVSEGPQFDWPSRDA